MDGLHVLELRAKNYLGLTLFEVEVNDDGLIVCGDNGAGKSSALSIFEACLGGAKGEPAVPIHAGAFKAEIATVVGKDGALVYTIHKVWEQGKPSRLELTDAAGAPVRKPQEVLNGLLGALTFDVGAFLLPPGAKTPEAIAKEQAKILIQACPIDVDLDSVAEQRKSLFDERTRVKRDVDTAAAELRLLAKQPVAEVVDLAAKRATVAAERSKGEALRSAGEAVQRIDREIEELKAKYKRLTEERAARVASAQALGTPADVTALEAEIVAGEKTNIERERVLAANARYDAGMKRLGESKRKADGLTESIEKLDREKADALARAAFPVPGLGIDEVLGVTVTVDGAVLPFRQVNAAKKAEIAVAVAAALSPGLRVARVDGNMFDAKTLAAVWAAAKARGLQLFVERIAQDVPGAIVIEAGQVAGVVPGAAS